MVTPASAAARNSRSRNSALNFGNTERWLAWVLTTGTSSSTTSSPGWRRKTCLDRRHDAGQRGALLQRDALRHRMHEERPQIVEPLGKELGDRVQIERHRAKRLSVGRQRHLADLDLAARAPRDDPRRARSRQPLDRVVADPAGGLGVALFELLDAAAGRGAAHDLIGDAERIQHFEHEQRDMRRLDHVAAGIEHDVRRLPGIRPRRATAG